MGLKMGRGKKLIETISVDENGLTVYSSNRTEPQICSEIFFIIHFLFIRVTERKQKACCSLQI